MRYEDLPPALKRRADAKLGRTARTRPAGGTSGGPCPYRCHQCGHESATWPKAEEHGQMSGHVRQDMVLEGPPA